MQLFHCSHCGFVVFFESFECVHCGSTLAFSPEDMAMVALMPADAPPAAGAAPSWQRRPARSPALAAAQGGADAPPRRYRLCSHRTPHGACNFSLPDDEATGPTPLCAACRQTRLLPDLSAPDNLRRWSQIEAAKRHLFYTLARLGLNGPAGPVYEFLADLPGAPPVVTGHAQGVITLNVAEADDDERTRRRLALHEPYRTLLGHLRHESGHYFWDALVLHGGHVEAFRALFGDERRDYAEALREHYARAPLHAQDWQNQHVSAYAAAHPWEDWAETWAHYLHLVDMLETAEAFRTRMSVPGPLEAPQYVMVNPFAWPAPSFDDMLAAWMPLTLLLNSLNRSLGQSDAYPFAPSSGAQRKLRFVHDLVRGQLPPPA